MENAFRGVGMWDFLQGTFHSESEDEYNLKYEVSSGENRTPVFGTPQHEDETESEEESHTQPNL